MARRYCNILKCSSSPDDNENSLRLKQLIFIQKSPVFPWLEKTYYIISSLQEIEYICTVIL